jgi:hypothetical protein
LPNGAKRALREQGLYPEGAQTASLVLEWALLLCVAAGELLLIMGGAVVAPVALGVLALLLMVDIPHRMVLAMDHRDSGLLGWPREVWKLLREEAPSDHEPVPPASEKRLE